MKGPREQGELQKKGEVIFLVVTVASKKTLSNKVALAL